MKKAQIAVHGFTRIRRGKLEAVRPYVVSRDQIREQLKQDKIEAAEKHGADPSNLRYEGPFVSNAAGMYIHQWTIIQPGHPSHGSTVSGKLYHIPTKITRQLTWKDYKPETEPEPEPEKVIGGYEDWDPENEKIVKGLMQQYNLKEVVFESTHYSQSEVLKAFTTQLELLTKRVQVDGRGVLTFTLRNFSKAEGGAKYGSDEIAMDDRYINSLSHEYGHFVFEKVIGDTEDAYYMSNIPNFTIAEHLTSENVKGMFDDWIAYFEAKTPQQKAYKELVGKLGEFYSNNVNKFRDDKNFWIDPEKTMINEDWFSYYFDLNETFSRVYDAYVTQMPGISPYDIIENGPDYFKIVNEWGDKYLKTGMIKSFRVAKHDANLEKARPYIRTKRGKLEQVKGYASRDRVADITHAERMDQAYSPNREDVKVASRIVHEIHANGGRAVVVGGFVRDALLGRSAKDIDIESFGIRGDELSNILSRIGSINAVGAQFEVQKVNTTELSEAGIEPIDVSLPRRDVKTGEGHKGFDVTADPSLSIEDAARRRDLTINTMSYDPITKEILDPFNGQQDLKDRKLRVVDENTFGEDPLRVLRVMRFAGQLGFSPDLKLVKICRSIDLTSLPKERIYGELEKLLMSRTPSIGLRLIPVLGIDKILPELKNLKGVPQDPKHHPEGSVFNHTMMAVDEAAKWRKKYSDKKDKMVLMLGILCHDLGKPDTTEIQEKTEISPLPPTEKSKFLHGGCYVLARELKKLLGGEIVGLYERETEFGGGKNPDHVAVFANGKYYDAYGESSFDRFITDRRTGSNMLVDEGYTIKPIPEEDLDRYIKMYSTKVSGFTPDGRNILESLVLDAQEAAGQMVKKVGKITTYGHDDLGEEIADKFLKRITNETDIIDRVKALVKYHMRVDMLYNDKSGPAAIRRLARKVDIPMLSVVEIADKTGRGTVPDISAVKWLLKKYKELNLDKPEELKPRVTGKHLITMGVAPGPEMGKILNTIYDAQMEGKFTDTEGGIEWARGEGLIKARTRGAKDIRQRKRRKLEHEIKEPKKEFTEKVEGGFDYDRWASGSRATKKIKTDPAQEAAIKRMYGIAKSFVGQPNTEEVKDKIRKATMKILSQPKPENQFTIDLQKSRKMLVKVRKSQLEGKSIPYKQDGKVIWAKVHEGGLVVKADKKNVIYGSKVFVKSDVAKVTGIGKDGITARTEGGKRHQVLFKDLNMWIER